MSLFHFLFLAWTRKGRYSQIQQMTGVSEWPTAPMSVSGWRSLRTKHKFWRTAVQRTIPYCWTRTVDRSIFLGDLSLAQIKWLACDILCQKGKQDGLSSAPESIQVHCKSFGFYCANLSPPSWVRLPKTGVSSSYVIRQPRAESSLLEKLQASGEIPGRWQLRPLADLLESSKNSKWLFRAFHFFTIQSHWEGGISLLQMYKQVFVFRSLDYVCLHSPCGSSTEKLVS